MKKIDSFYDNRIVDKPWGYEYVVYRNFNNLSVTLLSINYNKTTSLHCHPKKKSGFILVSGKALFQLGLWKKRSEIHSSPSKRMIARGLFHSIRALSKKGLLALEFETPINKNDLVRFKDDYGREQKSYEGKKFTKNIGSKFIKFKKPKIGKKQTYTIDKIKISLEVHKNFKTILRNKISTIFGILDGAIVDKHGRSVLSYGDIIRTNDLKTLSEVFKIKKYLSVVKVIRA
jgi:mannose-6-phosphate isomerase-like protein (cupin superfamily)